MKVKNEYIILNNGSKQIKLHNMILNKYLDIICKNQFIKEYDFETEGRIPIRMRDCYLKFDEQLNISADSDFTADDFDIRIINEKEKIETSDRKIHITYNYTAGDMKLDERSIFS